MDGNQQADGASSWYIGWGFLGGIMPYGGCKLGKKGPRSPLVWVGEGVDGCCYSVHICRLCSFVICHVLLILFPVFSLLYLALNALYPP